MVGHEMCSLYIVCFVRFVVGFDNERQRHAADCQRLFPQRQLLCEHVRLIFINRSDLLILKNHINLTYLYNFKLKIK